MRWKRAIDVAGAAAGLCVLAPVLATAAVLVRSKLGSPILFKQTRPGKGGVPFTIYKFRTMLDGKDAAGNPLPDEERLTSFGKFLRSSSIDELPELFNVLVGDMSLVGPRPLLMEYLDRYERWQNRRHDVKPGITGLAQVSGRNQLNWDKKFELDVWYVDNISPFLDAKILLQTITSVVKRDGISHEGSATMPKFGDDKT